MTEQTSNNSLSPEKETKIIQALLQCGLFLQRELNQAFREFNLNHQQFSVLNEIVRKGPISQKDLGERLFYEKSNISKIVKILLKKNLINIMPAPYDRRSMLLIERPEGLALWKNCIRKFNHASREFMSSLSEKDAIKTLEIMVKLQDALNPQK